jgi:hypothetical protein
MKKWIAVTTMALAAALPAHARDVAHLVPIAEALQSPLGQGRIDQSIALFFGPQQAPHGEARGSGNSRGKEKIELSDDKASCVASFAEALQLLQRRARGQGANAIVNIVSYYKNGPTMSSATQFECHAGTNNTGVMLQGDFVKLPS